MNYQDMSVEEAKKVIQECFEKLSKDLMKDDSLPIDARRDLWITLCGWGDLDPLLMVFCSYFEKYLKEIESDPKKGISESLSFEYARKMLEELAAIDLAYEALPRSEAAVAYTAYIGFFNVGLKKFCEKKEVSK